ncbi:MAG: flavocytochrome c [Clostridia bacterium]
MKRRNHLIARILILTGLLSCLAFGQVALAATPGTYTGHGEGNNGSVAVEVVIEEARIAGVKVTEHGETAGISDPAIERIPAAIVQGQTLAVDTVSGATNTSKAIIAAVEDCLTQAGLDVAAFMVAPQKAASAGKVIEQSADIVVIGGGGAGSIAAIQATQLGGSAIIIEKTAALGGNTAASGGNYAAVDPERQTPQGIEDSVEKHIQQVYEGGDELAKKELVEVMCTNALDGLHWLGDLGVEWNDTVFQVIGSLWPRTHSNIEKSGSHLVQVLRENVEALKIPVLYETKATELIVKDGRVVGVRASGADGNTYEVYGTKGVILTTGGFGSNLDLCMQYSSKIGPNTKSLSVASAQGDGLVMAEAVGAKLIDMDYVQMLPTSLTTLPGNNNSVLYLNQEGKRFTAEDGRRDKMSRSVLDQTGGYCYILIDQTVVDAEASREKADKLIASGDVIKAESMEELAQKTGMPLENLQATFDAYNALVSGNAQDEFGRTLAECPIGKAPYYCSSKQYPMVLYTCGGVDIDTTAHVLDENGARISGLFAAGEVTGGIHGDNRLGSHALADVTVFGRIAAKTALEG